MRCVECAGVPLQGAAPVPLRCRWGGAEGAAEGRVRAAARAHSSESSESDGCAARPPTAAAAARLGLARLSDSLSAFGLDRLPACGGGGGGGRGGWRRWWSRVLARLDARGGTRARPQCGGGMCCVRGMRARHVGRWPTVSLAPSERERVGAALARRVLACARTLRVVRVAAGRRVRPTALGIAPLDGGLGPRRRCGAEEAEDTALRGLRRRLRPRRAAMGRRLRGRPLVTWARAWEGGRA